ncbi:transcription factor with AP2 domain, putative [Babesia caballi]|uniref:Transcription factor with AP2 domain, putative n=1 Tax=Babesia caballi TaxID=5871 RepID=A0AAV4M1F9_BABCB|nr:transcription factor with AP2 domain, putative [Babesia caballi]
MVCNRCMGGGGGFTPTNGSVVGVCCIPQLPDMLPIQFYGSAGIPSHSYPVAQDHRLYPLGDNGNESVVFSENMSYTPMTYEQILSVDPNPNLPNDEDCLQRGLSLEYAQFQETLGYWEKALSDALKPVQRGHLQCEPHQGFEGMHHVPQTMDLKDLSEDHMQLTASPLSRLPDLILPPRSFVSQNPDLYTRDGPLNLPFIPLSYGATLPSTPTSGVALRADPTPTNIDGRCNFPEVNEVNQLPLQPTFEDKFDFNVETKPVVSLSSMASVSTVDLMNEGGIQRMDSGSSLEEFYSCEQSRKRTMSIDWTEEACPLTSVEWKKSKSTDFNGLDSEMEATRLYAPTDVGIREPVDSALWRCLTFGRDVETRDIEAEKDCAPPVSTSRCLTDPVVNGQINHRYFKRDFECTLARLGYSHLFPDLNKPSQLSGKSTVAVPGPTEGVLSCGTGTNAASGQTCTQLVTLVDTKAPNVSAGDLGAGQLRRTGDNSGEDNEDDENQNRTTGLAGRTLDEYHVEKNAPRKPHALLKQEFKRANASMSQSLKALDEGERMVIPMLASKRKDAIEVIKCTKCYDYLLDIPMKAEPDPELGDQQYKCVVPGVYWDKRSWIASWYYDGVRSYKSFSARLHGFFRAKYYAIHVRMYQSHTKAETLDRYALEFERLHTLRAVAKF